MTQQPSPQAIDPYCLMHGLRKSTHFCVQCCLCFKDLTLEECHIDPKDGLRCDICDNCAAEEAAIMAERGLTDD